MAGCGQRRSCWAFSKFCRAVVIWWSVAVGPPPNSRIIQNPGRKLPAAVVRRKLVRARAESGIPGRQGGPGVLWARRTSALGPPRCRPLKQRRPGVGRRFRVFRRGSAGGSAASNAPTTGAVCHVVQTQTAVERRWSARIRRRAWTGLAVAFPGVLGIRPKFVPLGFRPDSSRNVTDWALLRRRSSMFRDTSTSLSSNKRRRNAVRRSNRSWADATR